MKLIKLVNVESVYYANEIFVIYVQNIRICIMISNNAFAIHCTDMKSGEVYCLAVWWFFTNHTNCCDERPQEHNSKAKYTVLWEMTRGKSFSFGSSCNHVWLHKTLFLIIIPCQIQNIEYTTLRQYHIKIIILIWTQQKLLQYVMFSYFLLDLDFSHWI